MKLDISLARQLVRLLVGEAIPHSQFKKQGHTFLESNALSIRLSGRTKRLVVLQSSETLAHQLANQFGIADLDAYILLFESSNVSRSQAVLTASDSKAISVRTFKGFLVNVTHPVVCSLEGSEITLEPRAGLYYFINNPERFSVSKNCLVVGIENPENFRLPLQIEDRKQVIFVSRYPQSQSKDLVKWLVSRQLEYLHFGDFDFAGIRIYLSEFKKHLGERASFYLPADLEKLFKNHSTPERYDRQIQLIPTTEQLVEPGLKRVVDLINLFKAGLDQEILSVIKVDGKCY